MAEKQRVFQTTLAPNEAERLAEEGVASWKMGKVYGLRRESQGSYQMTRAGKQSGSLVGFDVDAADGGSLVTVWISSGFALKNPFTGVFGSVERSLRAGDSQVDRIR